MDVLYIHLDHSCNKCCDLIGQEEVYKSHIVLVNSHIVLINSHIRSTRKLSYSTRKFIACGMRST